MEEGSSQLLSTVVSSHFRDRPKATLTTSRTTAQKLYFFKPPAHSVSSTRPKKHTSLPEVKEVEEGKIPFEELTSTTPSQPQKKNTSAILSSHKKLAAISRTFKIPQNDRLKNIAQGFPVVKEVADKNPPEELTDATPAEPQEMDAFPPSQKLAVMPKINKTPHMDRLEHIRGKLHVLTDPIDLTIPHYVSERVSNDIDGRSPACGRPSVSATVSSTMKLVGRHLFLDSLTFDVI